MATDVKKVFELVNRGTEMKLPEDPQGKAVIRDEDGKDLITFGFCTKREIIREVGYEADMNLAADAVAAVAAVTELVKDKKVMEAALIAGKDIAGMMSDDGIVDKENELAVGVGEMLLKEALKTYAIYYKSQKEKQG